MGPGVRGRDTNKLAVGLLGPRLPAVGRTRGVRAAAWVAQLTIAVAFIKIGAAPKLANDEMSQEVFELVGAGSLGMYSVGVIELAAAVLLIVPWTSVYGAGLAAMSMIGALTAHLVTDLGPLPELANPATGEPETQPLIFFALGLLVLAAFVLIVRRHEIFGSAEQITGERPPRGV